MSSETRNKQEGIQPLHTKIDKIQWRLETQHGDSFSSIARDREALLVEVVPKQFKQTMTVLRRKPHLEYNYLSFIAGSDLIDGISLTYSLYSFDSNSWLRAKVVLDRKSPTIETVSDLWRAANWHERECFDLLGVTFMGHPNLKKILTPDELEGHPLRKDFKEEVGKLWLVRKVKRLQ